MEKRNARRKVILDWNLERTSSVQPARHVCRL